MNNQYARVGLGLISLIYLPLSFAFSLVELVNGRRWGMFLFSFSAGLLAFTLIPYENWDLTRHYATYIDYNNISFYDVWELSDNRYRAINEIIFLFKTLGIKKEFIPFFATFFSYAFYLTVYLSVINECKVRMGERLFFLYVLLSVIPFFLIASAFRQYLSFGIMLYCIIRIINNKNKLSLILLTFVALIIHPSVILLIFILMVRNLININRIMLFLAFLSLLFNINGDVSNFIFEIAKPVLSHFGLYFSAYMDISTIRKWNELLTTGQFVLNKLILPSLFYFLSLVFLFFYKKTDNDSENNLKRYAAVLLFLICLVSFSPDLFSRYSSFWVMLYLYVFFKYDSRKLLGLKKILCTVLIFTICSIVNLAQFNMGKDVIYRSWVDFLYKPSIILFVKEVRPVDYISVGQ